MQQDKYRERDRSHPWLFKCWHVLNINELTLWWWWWWWCVCVFRCSLMCCDKYIQNITTSSDWSIVSTTWFVTHTAHNAQISYMNADSWMWVRQYSHMRTLTINKSATWNNTSQQTWLHSLSCILTVNIWVMMSTGVYCQMIDQDITRADTMHCLNTSATTNILHGGLMISMNSTMRTCQYITTCVRTTNFNVPL